MGSRKELQHFGEERSSQPGEGGGSGSRLRKRQLAVVVQAASRQPRVSPWGQHPLHPTPLAGEDDPLRVRHLLLAQGRMGGRRLPLCLLPSLQTLNVASHAPPGSWRLRSPVNSRLEFGKARTSKPKAKASHPGSTRPHSTSRRVGSVGPFLVLFFHPTGGPDSQPVSGACPLSFYFEQITEDNFSLLQVPANTRLQQSSSRKSPENVG